MGQAITAIYQLVDGEQHRELMSYHTGLRAARQQQCSSKQVGAQRPSATMTDTDFGSLAFLLLLIIAAAHILGHLFARLRQPRVIGEILAGVLLGPSLLGRFAPAASAAIFAGVSGKNASHGDVLGFVYD